MMKDRLYQFMIAALVKLVLGKISAKFQCDANCYCWVLYVILTIIRAGYINDDDYSSTI